MSGGAPSFHDIERRMQQLLLLQETVKKVNAILDLDQLLDEIVGSVAAAFGCNRTGILLLDEPRNELEIIALRGFENVHLKGFRFKVGGEGIIGHVALTRKMWYAPDVRRDPYYVTSETSTLSEIDIPLISRGDFIGIFNAQSSRLDAFAPEQIEILGALADNIAIAIQNARLFRHERLEKEKAQREQEEARRIQRALLPESNPQLPGYSIDGLCLQLSAVGGDWYDYLPFDNRHLGIALGDVCGKGMAAALLMSATRSLLRRAAGADISPCHTLSRLNASLVKDLPQGRFVTMAYLKLEADTGTIAFSSAGHPHPLRIRPGSEPSELAAENGLPLGLFETEYPETRFTLDPGERLLIYSDGVLEACNSAGEEYGFRRLMQAAQSPALSAHQLLQDVKDFAAGGELADDATAVVIARN